MLVRDLMQTPVITIGHVDTLTQAKETMDAYDISCLPVTQGQEVVGILYRERLERALASPGIYGFTLVSWIMKRELNTIDGTEKLSRAIDVFLQKGEGVLLVMEAGRLSGILTQWDLMIALQNSLLAAETSGGQEELQVGDKGEYQIKDSKGRM